MNNRILVALAVVGAVIVSVVWWHNSSVQEQQAKQLEALQRRLENIGTAPRPVPEAEPVVMGAATQGSGTVERIRQTRAVTEEGWKLLAQRDPVRAREAIAVFQEGLEHVDGQNPEFYNGLGRAYLVAGRPWDAITTWRRGLQLAPRHADMQSGIGWGYWQMKDYYRAKQAWEAALALDPKSPDAWSALSWIYLELGDFEKAKTGFVLMFARNKDLSWNYGLTMARASNKDPAQISKFFSVPPPEAFAQAAGEDPVGTAPASQPG